jgi:hypothetical protein
MAALDPDVGVIARLIDERLADQETIQAQAEQIEMLTTVLHAQRRALCALGALADFLLEP